MLVREAVHCPETTVTGARAARELGLKPGEFALAVRLEQIPTVPTGVPWRRGVSRAELDRLRAEPGSQQTLRDRITVVDATAGASSLAISPARFARLARSGCFSPVDFHFNRYGLLVWRYPVVELRRVVRWQPELLSGRLPDRLRRVSRCQGDCRARRWRSRRTGQLIRQAEGPWQKAAVLAAVVDPAAFDALGLRLAERERLDRLRPPLATVRPAVPHRRREVAALVRAADPVEARWYQDGLARALREARERCPTPRTRHG